MSNPAGDETPPARPSWAYCVHGSAPYVVCLKCEEREWMRRREDLLYDTLGKFAAAVDRLSDVLSEGVKPSLR